MSGPNPLNPNLSNCFRKSEMAKRKMMVDESLRRKADPEYDALKHGLSLQPEHDDPHWTKMRHGHRGKFHKDARYMDNGALMTIRDERLIGNPRRNMSSLEAATKAHPKRVNKELYFSKGVFPPPFEILDQPNLAQAENIVERRRRHHFEEGVIQTARTARKQYPGPEKPEPSNAAFWSSGMVPPPTDGPKSLNASQEQNVVQRSKAREFGLNGCIMTYRRGDTGRSEMDTGRSTLRNGRSSAALEDLQHKRDKLKSEILKLQLQEELEDVDQKLATHRLQASSRSRRPGRSSRRDY